MYVNYTVYYIHTVYITYITYITNGNLSTLVDMNRLHVVTIIVTIISADNETLSAP